MSAPLCPQKPLVVFDLDGTLVDSRRDLAYAVNLTLGRHGWRQLPEDEIVGYVGNGMRRLLARAARLEPGDSDLDPLLATCLDIYVEHVADRTTLMPHAEEALMGLSHLPLAICTNKPRRPTVALLSLLHLAHRFSLVVCGDDLSAIKPDPLPLLTICDRLSIPPQSTVMVGDGPQDILCGRHAGAYTVGIPGCIASHQSLADAAADLTLGSLAELPPAVASWMSRRARLPSPPLATH